jgi:hypothetical protein
MEKVTCITLRSHRKIITNILPIPETILKYNLPKYINSNKKWTNMVSNGWHPSSWKITMLKIWKEKSLKKKQKNKILSLLLNDMKTYFGNNHIRTHRTILKFLKYGRGCDIFDDGKGKFGWGIGLSNIAEFIPYEGSDDENDSINDEVEMIKQFEMDKMN